MKKNELVLLAVIILAASTVRLYRFSAPLADWHSWRQVDTSSVSRNFIEKGFDLLNPTYHDLSNVPSRIDNPMGYRFVEFPIYNFLQAGFFKVFGTFNLEEWGRLVSILSSIFAIIFLYKFVSNRYGKITGYFSALFFAFLPFNIFYHRSVLPDTTMMMASIGGIYFFDKYISSNKKKFFIVSLFFVAAAFLLKPYEIFFILPIFAISYKKWGSAFFRKKSLWIFFVIGLTPFLLWRTWMMQHPEGIPQFLWLLNGDGIRFKPSFFYWIFYVRIIKLMLGFFGITFLFLGIISKKKDIVAMSFIASALAYLVTIATGNVRHDYYQILIAPTLCLFLAFGAVHILRIIKLKSIAVSLVCTLAIMSFLVSWKEIKNFYSVDMGLIEAAKTTDKILPKDAKIVVSRNGDTTFLYHANRKGWSSKQSSFEELAKMGASFFIIVYPAKADINIGKIYPIVYNSDTLLIFSLKK